MPVRVSMIRWSLALVAAMMVVLAAVGADARNAVTGIRLGAHPDGVTRFVMDLDDNLNFTVAAQVNPDRIVVSAANLAWNGVAARPFGSVSAVRYEPDRIVLALKEPAVVKSAFTIPPRDGQGWRFVMDLQQTTRSAFLAEAGVAAKPAPQAKPVAEAKPVQQSKLSTEARAASVAETPAAAPPHRIVFYSPEVTPPPSPAPPVARIEPPQPRPEPQTRTEPATPTKAPKLASGAVMSAPVPPPLDRPVAAPAVAAAIAPEPVPASAPVPAVAPAPAPAPVQPAITKAAATLPAPDPEPQIKRADGKPVIVIDPGHGGVDPGAIGVSGIYEKYITLAVARELKGQLEKGGRYKVHLTRDRDIFIRLRERVTIGRQHGADLFISLHADSVGNPQLKGLSIYTLSQNASDSEAQALADKENKADLIAGIDLSHESADVANILIDLAQRETMNRSAVFAGGMVDEVGRETQLLGNTHRFAGFAVLKAPDVPSVLVELGYLSNETEERNLRQPEYRARLAKAIARSVDRFFLQGQKAKRP